MAKGNPKKILFVIPSFAGGGAERILVNILKYIDRKRFSPLVAEFSPINDYLEEIPGDIRIICLNKKKKLDFFRLVYKLSKIIQEENPRVVVSFLFYANCVAILAAKLSGRRVPVVATEQNNPTLSLENGRFRVFKKLLIKHTYPKAACISACSAGVKKDLCENYKAQNSKCRVIYNSADVDNIRRKAAEEIEHPWFMEKVPVITACGRLTLQKNYPLLLNSLKAVLKEVEARLFVLGAGVKENELKNLAKELDIEKNVYFAGFRENPHKYIASSDFFVLSSDWEGFGNVIIEAMACGVPVISTRCPSGPDEIITDGEDGLLVPVGDANAMADAILKLLSDEPLRKRLGEAGRRRAEDFRVEKMVAEYEKVFEEAYS